MFCRKIIDKIRFILYRLLFTDKYEKEIYSKRCEALIKVIQNQNIENLKYEKLKNLYINLTRYCIDIPNNIITFFLINDIIYLYKLEIKDDIFFDNEISFCIYDMFISCKNNMVCKIVCSISYKNKKIEIDTINTYPNYERLGFATRLLSYLEDYACKNCINEIYGNIEIKSYIGFDNLIKFYEKNGYNIYKTKENNYYFRKIITGQ